MKRTSIKVRVKNGCSWLTRTVYEKDGAHFIKADGRYFPICKTERGIYKSYLYIRVEYIAA